MFRLQSGRSERRLDSEAVTQHGQRTVMAQQFIPEISEGDKRILVIGGKPVPFSLARIPAPGETRQSRRRRQRQSATADKARRDDRACGG